jgi:hypothetical protein
MGSASGSFGNAEVTTGDSRSGEESVHQPAEAEDDTITPRLSDQDGAVAICGGCGIVGGSACLLLFDTFAFRFETDLLQQRRDALESDRLRVADQLEVAREQRLQLVHEFGRRRRMADLM